MTTQVTRPDLTIRISNDVEAIAFFRMVMRHVLPPLDEVQEPLYFGALTEIVTNAIEEHQRGGSDADVEITVELGSTPSITVSDTGQGFDPDIRPTSPAESGRGLVISRSVVPDLRIESSSSGTRVTLPYPEATP